MTLPLKLGREAEQEIEAAWLWYEERRPGLGRDFLLSVEETLRRLEGPVVGLSVEGVGRDLRIRRLPVRRFPYSIVYVDLPAERRVLAIAHGSRRPGFWHGRLGKLE